jgi:ABC-type amino acid transport substrate-binding protein
MKLHHYMVALFFLLTFPADAGEQLHFARIGYSPIQNVGQKVMEEVYRRAGVDLVVKELPAKRAAYETGKGFRDGEIMRIRAYLDDDSPLYRIPYSLGDVKTQIYVRELLADIQLSQLKDYKVAVVRGVRHTNIYVQGFEHVLEVDDVAEAMKLLYMKRVDAVVVSQLNGEYEIKAQNITGIVPLAGPVVVQGNYHYINKKYPHIIQKVEGTLKAMYESGELKALWDGLVQAELNKASAAGRKK